MLIHLADVLRLIAVKADDSEVVKKFRPEPGIKPARRKPSFQSKSNQSHYQRDYKREQQEQGKGYQKVPDEVKKWRREQRKKLKKNILHKDDTSNESS